jgi:hypothetical protein
MLAIEKDICAILESGKVPSLEDLGGTDLIISNAGSLVTSRFSPEIFRAIMIKYEMLSRHEQESLEDFLVNCVADVSNEFCAQELVDIIDYSPMPCHLEDRFYKALLWVAKETSRPAMTRAFALDGSLRLTSKKPSRRHSLFAMLLEIEDSEQPVFIKHSAKIAGVANSHWPTEEILPLLQRFMAIDEAKSESAYELGMAHLRTGFDAQDKLSAIDSFTNALLWFQESTKHGEQRLDAELYGLSLSILTEYSQEQLDKSKLLDRAASLQRTAFLYEAWVENEALPSWLGARRTELVNWILLAKTLERLAESLGQPSWFEPRSVIEDYLLKSYTASRSYLQRTKSGGIERIIAPQIEASLIKKEGQLNHLRQWLEHVDQSEWTAVAAELLTKLDEEHGRIHANPAEATPCDHRGVAFLHNHKAPTPLIEAYQFSYIHNVEYSSPHVEKIIEDCDSKLKLANHDYKNEKVRGVFLPLLLGTLLFLESRMNLTRGSHRGVSYLFQESPLPSERDLQEDYFIFMHSNLRGITVERSDVAGGRADVLFESKGIRTASELKKEEISCSFEDIENCYAAQGVEYQNTNIRLGILLVLDLTLKNSGVGHITSQVCQRQLKTDPLFVSVGN